MPPIRVLELIKTLNTGGAEMLLTERLRLAPQTGCEYVVACLHASSDGLMDDLRTAGIRVLNLTSRPAPLAYPRLLAAVWRHRPDVVNAHSPLLAGLLRPLTRLMRRRPRFVSTVHNIRCRPTTMLIDGLTRGLDDRTVAVSPQVARARTVRGASRLAVRIHGVDVRRQRRWADEAGAIRADAGVPDGAFAVVCVANLSPQKNHLRLVRAAHQVLQARPDALFLLAGEGPQRDLIAAEIDRAGLADRVRLLGAVPRAGRLLAAADLAVLSSDHEGLPVVVMEALAAGVPVVAPAVGGVPDLVAHGHNGILAEPGSDDALARAVLAAMEPATHKRLRRGAAGDEPLDIVLTAAWFEELYRDLATARRG